MEAPRIRKVPIRMLTELLAKLYDRGVDYVDFTGKRIDEDEDLLGVSFCKEYMDPEFVQSFEELLGDGDLITEEEEDNENVNIKLTDDDINNLL